MKIAVTYEDGNVFQHFGHTENFKIYDVENATVLSSVIVGTDGSGHGALATFLKDKGVETLICGGIGDGAKTALSDAGISLYGGVTGSADDAVNALLAGKLSYNPNVKCTHHDHENHEEGAAHSCGSKGCSSHK